MEYSANSSSLRSGAEPQQQRCRRCDGRCGHSESITTSNTVERVLVRQRVGLTEYGGGPSRSRTPPPPYSVPAPQVDAPAPQALVADVATVRSRSTVEAAHNWSTG
uniref:SFRICE_030914 n=1 Tax=Spodoptera frugiperda TaxID=7108 RepID=A0A2H1WXL8_SPOFR